MKFHSASIEAQINLKLELNLQTKKSTFDYKAQQIGNYIEQKIQQQLHYSGTFSYFHFCRNKYFIGTAEGILFINNTPLQLQSPKTQNGLFSNLLYTLIPFKSTISQPNRKSFLYNIVDVSYKRQPTYQEKLNLKIVTATLTKDEELLMVSLQLGEIHIFSYPSLILLNVIELWSPQKYLYFYCEPSHKGVFNILENQLHENYEFVCADQYGTLHKFCLDYYKFIKKKTLTYKHFLLLERGQAQYVPKWWEQAQLEFEVEVYQDKQRTQLIFDFQYLQNNQFILLWWNRIEIIEISEGKKDKSIQYQILKSFQLLQLDTFYEKFNQFSKDEKINVNQDHSSIFIQNNTIAFNKGPTIYLTDSQLTPQRFGILSYPLSLLDDSILPSIIYIKFIDQSILLVIYSNNDAFLFRTDKFGLNYEFANQLKRSNLDYPQMLSYTVNGLKINDFKTSSFKCFSFQEDKFIYLDNKNRVVQNSLQYWKAYISQFNYNKRYLDGIAECYQIITMNNPYLNSLPIKKDILQKEITLLIEELVYNFVNSIHDADNRIEEIKLLIEFLLCSNNERMLFLDIRKLLIKANKLPLLYQIIKNIRINQISDDIVPEVMKEVNQQQQFDILSQLDPLKVDKKIISDVCLEKGFLELLIYFCNENSDYTSPLVKLIGYKEYYVQYILMILSGQGIQGERLITLEHWLGVKQILENILFNNNLVQLLKYDTRLSVPIQIFQQSCAQVILQQQDRIQIHLDEQKIQQYSTVLENNNANVMSKIFLIIYLTYSELLESEEVDFKFEYLAYFVSQTIFTKLITFKISEHFKLIKYYLDQFNSFNLSNIIDKNQFYLNHLLIYFNNQRLSLLDIEQCVVLLNSNIRENSLIYCCLLNQQGKYTECFQQWIKIKIQQLQQLIFEWLENIFKQKLDRQLQYSFILEATKNLIQIDSKQTFKIINKHFNYLQVQLINDIGDSENQLNGFVEYMQQILDSKIFLKDEIKIKYVTYLCKNEPKQVKATLIKYHFPLKQCLSVCEQFQNVGSCLLINMMMGDYRNVIQLMSTKLVQKIKICIKGILKLKQLDMKDRDNVIKQLNKIKDVCSQQQQEYQLTDNLYLVCLDRFFKDNPLRNLTHSSLPQLIKDQLLLVVVSLLYNMLTQMNFYDFAQIITIKYKDMPVSIFSRILGNINEIRHQQREFYHQGQLLIDQTKYQLLYQLYNKCNIGYCIRERACQCQVNDQFMIVYPCNHCFHLCCLSNNKAQCPLCYDYLEFRVMNYPTKKISLNQQQQIKDKKLIQSQRIDKMKQFEHIRLQNEQEYLNNLQLL